MADLGSAIDGMELTLEEIDANTGVNAEARQEERPITPTSKDMLRYEMQKNTMKKLAKYSEKEAESKDPSQIEHTNSTVRKGTWNELRIGSKDLSDDEESEESAEQTRKVPSFENLKHTESAVVDKTNSDKRGEVEFEIGAPQISDVDEVLQPQTSATYQIKTLFLTVREYFCSMRY